MALSRRQRSLATQTFELAMAAPQVIAHRMARIALAGTSPSARDRAEFQRMGTEKLEVAGEAWTAMAAQALSENQKFTIRFMQSLWFPWMHPAMTPTSVSRQMNEAAIGILGKGMAPVRRRAVENAKRLGRSNLG